MQGAVGRKGRWRRSRHHGHARATRARTDRRAARCGRLAKAGPVATFRMSSSGTRKHWAVSSLLVVFHVRKLSDLHRMLNFWRNSANSEKGGGLIESTGAHAAPVVVFCYDFIERNRAFHDAGFNYYVRNGFSLPSTRKGWTEWSWAARQASRSSRLPLVEGASSSIVTRACAAAITSGKPQVHHAAESTGRDAREPAALRIMVAGWREVLGTTARSHPDCA